MLLPRALNPFWEVACRLPLRRLLSCRRKCSLPLPSSWISPTRSSWLPSATAVNSLASSAVGTSSQTSFFKTLLSAFSPIQTPKPTLPARRAFTPTSSAASSSYVARTCYYSARSISTRTTIHLRATSRQTSSLCTAWRPRRRRKTRPATRVASRSWASWVSRARTWARFCCEAFHWERLFSSTVFYE